jgi:hypothetical protein
MLASRKVWIEGTWLLCLHCVRWEKLTPRGARYASMASRTIGLRENGGGGDARLILPRIVDSVLTSWLGLLCALLENKLLTVENVN